MLPGLPRVRVHISRFYRVSHSAALCLHDAPPAARSLVLS